MDKENRKLLYVNESRSLKDIIDVLNEDEDKIISLFLEAFLLRRKKGEDYGDVWRDLGARAQWAQMYIKTMRLKELLWKGKNPKNESIRDSLIDLLNYTFHTLVLYNEETEKNNDSPTEN